MAKHTQEPWFHRYDGPTSVYGAAGERVADLTNRSEANARRIVACVNACAGIPTEALEQLAADSAQARSNVLADILAMHEREGA